MFLADLLRSIADVLSPMATIERPSPKIRITAEQADSAIRVLKAVLGYENCFIAAIAPTNSMEPGIDDGQYVLLDPMVPYGELIAGDIIWYEHPQFQAIHRIIEIGMDTEWYCRCRGDNNGVDDPVKIRPEHIKGVWRMTLN